MEIITRIAGLADLAAVAFLFTRIHNKRLRVYQNKLLWAIYWVFQILGIIALLTGLWQIVALFGAIFIPGAMIVAFIRYSDTLDKVEQIPELQKLLSNALRERRFFEANVFENYLKNLEESYVEAFEMIHGRSKSPNGNKEQ